MSTGAEENAYHLLQEARWLLGNSQPDRAASLLEKAKALEPGRGSILEALGTAYYNSGRPDRALREFEEALEVDPTNHFARYGLGRCLYRTGKLRMAIGQMKLAAVMAPGVELYRETLRRFQRELERKGEARA
ncbi:tetratricopeptide repeat protein [Candidatus Solincola tengchongensis]|uniref:tetratricopeptide repeat protein n=1 Tax=Candidatus Solincola tengchongensis TaxID=2900693 RepID=UPI00257A6D17|nr:tetratricopeptide repeat protein [Candidatus Solincola tengchongensis]